VEEEFEDVYFFLQILFSWNASVMHWCWQNT